MLHKLLKLVVIIALVFAFQPKAMACRRHRDVDWQALSGDDQEHFCSNDNPFNICADNDASPHISMFKSPAPTGGALAGQSSPNTFKAGINLRAGNVSNAPAFLFQKLILFPFHGFW